MQVVLKEDIPKLGKMGEVIRVRNGYARNYLLPRGLVLLANSKNLNALEHEKRIIAGRRDRVVRDAQTLCDKIAALDLTITARTGEEGKLFGSVTNIHIEKALAKNGFQIERRKIDLPQPIKTVGNYEVPIRLASDVVANVKVSVVPEEASRT
ncbi:MAG TPA: 50S ribosomal protein L9 [Candidatus Binatia bacterium]